MSDLSLVISHLVGETRLACVEDEGLRDLFWHLEGASTGPAKLHKGDICAARVSAVNSNLNAAFIEVGGSRAAYLSAKDARLANSSLPADAPITSLVNEGDRLIVQVAREATSDKGAQVTCRLNLNGRYMVLTPGAAGVNVSRKIADDQRRIQLKQTLSPILSDLENGLVIRTKAAEASAETLIEELNGLQRLYQRLTTLFNDEPSPRVLYSDHDPIFEAVLSYADQDLQAIIVDDADYMLQLKRACLEQAPMLVELFQLHNARTDVFSAYEVTEALDELLSPHVALAGGASLVIEKTTAMWTIDVNSGPAQQGGGSFEARALETNLQAIPPLMRQIALRQISGIIMVDFINLNSPNARKRLDQAMRSAAQEVAGLHVHGLTRLGVMELSRDRSRTSLPEIAASPLAKVFEILRTLQSEAKDHLGRPAEILCTPMSKRLLETQAAPALSKIAARLGIPIHLSLAPSNDLSPIIWR